MTFPFWLNWAIKSALFYGGWIYCLQAVNEYNPFQGTAVISAIVAYLFLVSNNRIADFILVLSIPLCGAISDSLYALCGMIVYKCTYVSLPWIAPYWLVSLWVLFAALIRESLAWLYGRWWIAVLLGSAGGVSSYLGGMAMGAAEMGISTNYGIVVGVLAIVWAAMLPLAVAYSKWVERLTGKWNRKEARPQLD